MDDLVRIESEISQLQENELKYPVNFKKYKSEYLIDITVPQKLIGIQTITEDIVFCLYVIGIRYPFIPPKLYCITQFSYPSISDCRDLLKVVMKESWSENKKLLDILLLLKDFLTNYMSNNNIYIGNYYLGSLYDIKLLNKINYTMRIVKENIVLNGKWTKLQRIAIISDTYFLLFEQDKENKNKLILNFWAPINSVLKIKRILVNKEVFISFRQNFTHIPFELCLTVEKGDEIVELILQKMQYFGMNYNETKQKNLYSYNTPKFDENSSRTTLLTPSGVDINKVLEEIKKNEELIKQDVENVELKELLFNLYINAEKYYGAQVDTENALKYKQKRESILI